MNPFIQKYGSEVIGVLTGFDRVVIRGHIRQLAYVDGMKCYMAINGIRTVDFKQHVLQVTARLREAVESQLRACQRPVLYLESTSVDKEKLVQQIVAQQGLVQGPICLLSCVEPCRTFVAYRDKNSKTVDVRARRSKCLFLYKYSFHPRLGYIQARIQSWFPFNVQVYFNGREWLARQMEAAGLTYRRCDNTFVWLQDVARAQQLMDEQLRCCWPQLLEEIMADLNPLHPAAMFGNFRAPYYWSVYQTEWATDVMFKTPETLAHVYRPLALHAIGSLSCHDVLRFLGHRFPSRFERDTRTRMVERVEGLRVKHGADGNSLKAYDKFYAQQPGDWSILRLEATSTNPTSYKVFRTTETNPDGPKRWLPCRKGVADLYRLAQVSQAANDRYAQALLAADCSQTCGQITGQLCHPVTYLSRRYRGLRPWAPDDLALLRIVNRGEFALNGLRNRDVRQLLYDKPSADPKEQRRRSARVGRLLRLLRAHSIIKKVPKTHRYQLTLPGRKAIAAILAAIDATTEQLSKLAG